VADAAGAAAAAGFSLPALPLAGGFSLPAPLLAAEAAATP
jgi:hypothetical protein